MTAMTLQALSGNRFLCGIGPSGPQVVEGWHGVPFGKPLARTREYIAIIRQILERKAPLEFHGEHYQIPYTGPGSTGLGKPLRSIIHGDPEPEDLHRGDRTRRAAHRRRSGRRDAAVLHVAGAGRGDRRAGAGGHRQGRQRQDPRRFRYRSLCPGRDRRRSGGLPRHDPAQSRALYRRHGRALEEFLQRSGEAHGLRGGGGNDPGPLSRRPAQGGRGGGARRADRRDLAGRPEGADHATGCRPGRRSPGTTGSARWCWPAPISRRCASSPKRCCESDADERLARRPRRRDRTRGLCLCPGAANARAVGRGRIARLGSVRRQLERSRRRHLHGRWRALSPPPLRRLPRDPGGNRAQAASAALSEPGLQPAQRRRSSAGSSR